MYIACNWSWADAEGMEEELVEDINSTFVSPDFLIAWRSTGTGEPVPLSLLTIDQLVEVVNTNQQQEKGNWRRKNSTQRSVNNMLTELISYLLFKHFYFSKF